MCGLYGHMPAQRRRRLFDDAVRSWIEARGGVVSRAELLRRVEAPAIDGWIANGWLVVLFRGVYGLVGFATLRDQARWRAAVLAAGRDAALSHDSASAARGMATASWDRLHVTTPHSATRRPALGPEAATGPELVVHRTSVLGPADVGQVGIVRVTSLARTIVDWADVTTYAELREGVDRLPRFPASALRATQVRLPGRHGARRVEQLLGRDEAHTKSVMEREYLRFLRRSGLPRPDALNVVVGGCKVDALYRDAALAVELDGRAHHARRAQMREDRRRDDRLRLAGAHPFRLLWEEIAYPEEQDETAARQRALMALGAPAGGGLRR